MSKPKNRGTPPIPPQGKLPEAAAPRDHNDETPKFCLHYLSKDLDVQALELRHQAAFAKCLQKLAASTWKDILSRDRHGQGAEFVTRAQIRGSVPERFTDSTRFMVFRYSGQRPMAGVRVDAVFHVLWIAPSFNELYNH